MKILHITATHLNPDGGVPVVLKELCTSQNKIDGFESRVISLVAPVSKMNSEYFEYVQNKEFVNYINKYRPDFAILHSFFYFEYNSVVRKLVKKGIPYYIEPHGSFGKEALKKSRIKKFIALNTIFSAQIKNAYGYIFLNKKEMDSSKYRTKNDIIIPNGINKNSILSTVRKESKCNFYFIGRIDVFQKGLDFLLESLRFLDCEGISINLHIWGKGNSKDTLFVKEKIDHLKNVNVEFSDSIYGIEKDNILEQCGPMILTSRYEGLPMTVLESWKYGNPCIVTEGTNMTTEVEKYNLGWVTKLDGRSIADTIIKANNDYRKNRDAYVKRCKQYVEDNYSWDKIASDSYKLFRENCR